MTCACRDGLFKSWKMSNPNNTLTVYLYGDKDPEQRDSPGKRSSGVYWIENPSDSGTLIRFTEFFTEN